MFARFVALLSIATLATSAVAAPNPLEARGDDSQCEGGAVKCCNQEFKGVTLFKTLSGSSLADAVLGAVANVGLTCNPIHVIGIGSGAQCQGQTVCCTGEQDGARGFQCAPRGLNVA